MKIKCILIDDEPFALDILEDDLHDFDNFEVVAKFLTPHEALDFLEKEKVDLIFSDIQMPGQLGTAFVKSLKEPPLVIFTTAFHQYAVEGFELNAIDYLMKPIRKERLGQALQKVENQLALIKSNDNPSEENFIHVFAEYKKVKVFFDEILYVEGLKDYVKIYLQNRVHPLLTRSNLKGMEGKLPEATFLRIHNSYIINKTKVEAFTQAKVQISGAEIPVGKKFADCLLQL
ncbi:LytR/AlgR family response regulator transcription factor [Lacihabitans lacunae]|uniref:LytR/AlgR family response regulator transcription factor n=1 Tax=Lacihabitans lacunae TaxID=1028214 RepID=A0ABV7YVB6_9BACT